MPSPSVRYGQPDPGEPVIHELPPMRYGGDEIPIRLSVRRTDDGGWRGRLLFGVGEAETPTETAEIFFGENETDLWQAVRDLREHHLRDLYRSLAE
jgi:hypothetical protein